MADFYFSLKFGNLYFKKTYPFITGLSSRYMHIYNVQPGIKPLDFIRLTKLYTISGTIPPSYRVV